ncbi:C40 family peptidase [Lysobacter fragariae]
MTTRKHGRPAATTLKPVRAAFRLSLALALCAGPLSALATPIDDDSAPFAVAAAPAATVAVATPATPAVAKPRLAPVSRVALPESPSLASRALSLAVGVKNLLSPISLSPLSLDLPEEAMGEPLTAEGNGKVQGVLQKALALLGTPYRWGGTDPNKGLDCSGLVGYVFRNALGIELPRVSRDMAKSGELITDRAKLAAGDLVFFGLKGRVNHVGIYVGDGRFVHAPSRGKNVMVSQLDKGYWSGRFVQARRVSPDGT